MALADVVVEPFTDGTLSESIRNILSGRDEQRATSRGTREVARQAVCARALDRPYVGIVKAPNWACSPTPEATSPTHLRRPGGWLWNELHTTQPTHALSFYERIVGFTHRSIDMGPCRTHHILSRDGVDGGRVADHLSGGARAHWLPQVAIDDVDLAIDRAHRRGARIAAGPEDISGIGRFGLLEDPTGPVLAS